MTRSGMSLEELRIVEGQGQSSEVITPSEELNRINDIGTAARLQVNFDLLSQKEKYTRPTVPLKVLSVQNLPCSFHNSYTDYKKNKHQSLSMHHTTVPPNTPSVTS